MIESLSSAMDTWKAEDDDPRSPVLRFAPMNNNPGPGRLLQEETARIQRQNQAHRFSTDRDVVLNFERPRPQTPPIMPRIQTPPISFSLPERTRQPEFFLPSREPLYDYSFSSYHRNYQNNESLIEVYERLSDPLWKSVWLLPYKLLIVGRDLGKYNQGLELLFVFMAILPVLSFFVPITVITAMGQGIWVTGSYIFEFASSFFKKNNV